MKESEEDYMSACFLDEVNSGKRRERERGKSVARDITGNKQQKKKQRRFAQQEHMQTAMTEGMKKPIQENNKGFKLLEKFGFKKEEGGLGKSGKGIQEPIQAARLQGSNFGLGKEKAIREVQARVEEELIKHNKKMASLEGSFRLSLQHAQVIKNLHRDIKQSERVIEQLDEKKGVERHDLWSPEDSEQQSVECPEVLLEVNKETASEVDEYSEAIRKLEERILYLRSVHTYCLYCGCAFLDCDDMSDNCDGPLREDH